MEHTEFGGDSESSFVGRRAIVITVVQRQFGSMHSQLACIDIYSGGGVLVLLNFFYG